MALIFMSHSSKDNDKVAAIQEGFRQADIHSIFLDFDEHDGLKGGEEWEKKLYHEIQRTHLMVILLSPNWIDSCWCEKEYSQALALGREILPIIIEADAEGRVYNWLGKHLQTYDLLKDSRALGKLISRIKEVTQTTPQKAFKWEQSGSPYPGLSAFDERYAAVFYGRNREIDTILNQLNSFGNLGSHKLYNIMGASGMGKSSLMRAGVLPFLQFRYGYKWRILPTLQPAKEPLTQLVMTLVKAVDQEARFEEILESLKGEAFAEELDRLFNQLNLLDKEPKKILLPIDQAEELFTTAKSEEKRLFLRLFEYLLEQKSNFFAIWTFRSDFLKLFQSDEAVQRLHQTEIIYNDTLAPIRLEQISSIILEPAKEVGIEIEPLLIETIVHDLKNTKALPLLAYTLHELYSKYAQNGKLTLSDYQALALHVLSMRNYLSILSIKLNKKGKECVE